MKPTGFTISLAIAIAVMLPTILEADNIPLSTPSPRIEVMLLASHISSQSGVNPSVIKNVLRHESDYDRNAVGDHGLARNVAQYHRDEFDGYNRMYSSRFGTTLNYDSAEDQIRLMAYQFRYWPASRNDWSAYRQLYGKES